MRALGAAMLMLLATSARADLEGLVDEKPAERTVVASGARTIVLEPRSGGWVALALHGQAPPVELERWGAEDGGSTRPTLTVKMTPFLGHGEVLDVFIVSRWMRPQHQMHHEAHHLLRLGREADEKVCDVEGDSAGGSEYSEYNSTVKLEKVADEPLRFDAITDTYQRHRTRNTGQTQTHSRATMRYVIPAIGRCTSKPRQ